MRRDRTTGIFGPSGTDPSVTIPVVLVSQADGNTIRAQLGTGVTATVGLDPAHFAGVHDPDERMLLYTPNPYQQGSSVSHWDTSALPNLLMEPAINSDLNGSVDMTRYLFEDIGWFPRTTDVPLAGAAPARFSAGPNPFRNGAALQLALAHPGVVNVTLYDVSGRAVRHLSQGWMPAGTHTLSWDGVDDGGVAAPAGLYLARLRGPDGEATARLMRVR